MIVKLVKDGHIVGRIKGGDPYVFGRGGEEVLSLQKEGLEFEVIPGVTSPIAVLNYAGIPITQRGMSQGFHIITGMTAADEKINWQALAKEIGTLVFMMGLENIERIMSNLLENGKFDELVAYLREHIQFDGALHNYEYILNRATKEDFNPRYYVDYLKNKYTKLYE